MAQNVPVIWFTWPWRGLGVGGRVRAPKRARPWQTTPVRLSNGSWPIFPVLGGLHGLSTECGLFRLSPAVWGAYYPQLAAGQHRTRANLTITAIMMINTAPLPPIPVLWGILTLFDDVSSAAGHLLGR